jgi:hypothetical protein
MINFTQQQWQLLVEAGAQKPEPLHLADLSRPFVYDREVGVFYCAPGLHRLAMSLLLAFRHGCENVIEVGEKLGLDFPDDTADRWLAETPGAAFRSSVGRKVQAGKRANLSMIEKRWLGELEFIFED